MTKFAFGAALGVLAATIPVSAPAQRLSPAIVAVVDTNRVARECNACRTAQTQLQTQAQQVQQLQTSLRTPIETEANALRPLVDALQGKAPDAALQARIQRLQTQQNTANTQLQQRAQALQSTEQNVVQQINTALGPIINQVMQTRGASIVVDRGAALAVSPSIDVTNDVLAALNTSLTTLSVTPLPQQQAPAQQQPQGR
jgi:Skp family chaperone for outer membrane proteins